MCALVTGVQTFALPILRLLDEIFDHLLSNIDVRNHAIAQRPDGFDIIWRFSHHQLGVIADRFDSPDAILGFDGYDRRFVEHDATSAPIYESIRRDRKSVVEGKSGSLR